MGCSGIGSMDSASTSQPLTKNSKFMILFNFVDHSPGICLISHVVKPVLPQRRGCCKDATTNLRYTPFETLLKVFLSSALLLSYFILFHFSCPWADYFYATVHWRIREVSQLQSTPGSSPTVKVPATADSSNKCSF